MAIQYLYIWHPAISNHFIFNTTLIWAINQQVMLPQAQQDFQNLVFVTGIPAPSTLIYGRIPHPLIVGWDSSVQSAKVR